MSDDFADHFGPLASHYAAFRPHYPGPLFDWVASQCTHRRRAWDCATGSGQAALGLATHFDAVIATDASASQLASASPHERIEYREAAAEQSGLAAGSIDLVAVAQALHWFDLDAFYDEVRRVLTPGGVFAVWSYGNCWLDDADVHAQVQAYYTGTLAGFWPAERIHVENGYADLPFPFARLAVPAFEIVERWDLPGVLGYLRSWSASGHYVAARGEAGFLEFGARLAQAWGEPARRIAIRWPLAVHAARI